MDSFFISIRSKWGGASYLLLYGILNPYKRWLLQHSIKTILGLILKVRGRRDNVTISILRESTKLLSMILMFIGEVENFY